MNRKKVFLAAFAVAASISVAAQNPIVQTCYTSDPAPMVSNDRIYVYTGHDEDGADFFWMYEWRLYSSSDMVNWTDHGVPLSLNSFSWADDRAWAAQCIERNGKFFWYVCAHSNITNGMAIGVAVGDTPTGPFRDAIGKPLFDNGSWDNIDPTVFIDDDDQAWLIWGNPTINYVKLNPDMISFKGEVKQIEQTVEGFGAPGMKKREKDMKYKDCYVEGPWITKRNHQYQLLYAAGGIPEHIAYSTAPSIEGPWTYRGAIMPQEDTKSFTNHCGVADFKGHSYFFYHTGKLPGGGGFGRSVAVEEFTYNADGSFPVIHHSDTGVSPIGTLNPYQRQEAETMAWSYGVKTECNQQTGVFVCDIHNSDYIQVREVDFGQTAPTAFTVTAASALQGGRIEIHLDSLKGMKIATANIPCTGGWEQWKHVHAVINEKVQDKHDVFFVFSGNKGAKLFNLDWWQFEADGKQTTENLDETRLNHNRPILKTHVETGDVEGILDNSLAIYKAIPYAAPPIGDLRWKEPQPPMPWKSVLKANDFGPWPPQPSRRDGSHPKMSEDCLYLGIATPATTANDSLPVMVWIHGGGFQTEHYGGDLWKHLAKRGVVIVSIEYRTGALGFMAHPELTKESKNGHSGNYGLLDQIYALKWVQRNIANFGGDPNKVTIFGESAGAISCSILCASPLAKGLFRACISQSGGSFAPWSDKTRTLAVNASQKGAEQQGMDFQKHLKKKSLKQLRRMDALELCGDNVGFNGFWPCVDGYVITDDLYRLYERGEYNDVPVIVMTNSDEGALFSGNINPDDYKKSVHGIFGPFAEEALKHYPGNTKDEAYQGNADAFRDMGFAWPSFTWVNLQSHTGKSPAYAAFLAQPSSRSFSGDPRRKGVAHADDILYLNGEFLTQPNKYPDEAAVAEIIQQYWINFAKTGNPNAPGLPYWPSFDASKPTTMQFSNGASLITWSPTEIRLIS